jgi:hypothetical protein
MCKKMSEKKKCNFKCSTCQNYNRVSDYCKEKEIKHCSKQVHTDFSTCDSYLIRDNLIMF